MAIIAFIGNKGGAGKTTLAINLASVLNQQANTRLLDADPQGSSLHWAAMADDDSTPEIIDATADIASAVEQYRNNADHLVIDCPPALHSAQTQAALELCHVAVIPVLPSPLDLWATVAVDEALDGVRSINPGLKPLLVINQLEPRTKLSRLVGEAITELNIPAANTALRRRAVYRSSVLQGKSVHQMGKVGAAATEEINQLIAEVLTL